MILKPNVILILTSLLALSTASCGALSGGGFDCETQGEAYEQEEASQGILLDSLPDYAGTPESERAYPMALVLSTDAVNTLLAASLGQELPEIERSVALLTVGVQPSLPLLQIGANDDVLVSLDMGLSVGISGATSTNGSATATMRIPVELAPQSERETFLMARMDQAEFLDIAVSINGLSSGNSRLVTELLTSLATDIIQSEYGPTNVTSVSSWSLGDGDMLLSAQGLRISGAEGTILIGLGTNVAVTTSGNFQPDELVAQASLPQDAQVGLHLHPDLLLGVSQRLMNEGHIARDYDEDGAADADGVHQVTLTGMTLSETGTDALTTEFRVWRTAGGLCGFADVASDLAFQVSGDAVTLDVSNLEVTGGEGSGEILAESAWLAGDFLDVLAEQLSLTVNYRDFAIEGDGGSVIPRANSATINGRGMSVYLDLTTLVD